MNRNLLCLASQKFVKSFDCRFSLCNKPSKEVCLEELIGTGSTAEEGPGHEQIARSWNAKETLKGMVDLEGCSFKTVRILCLAAAKTQVYRATWHGTDVAAKKLRSKGQDGRDRYVSSLYVSARLV